MNIKTYFGLEPYGEDNEECLMRYEEIPTLPDFKPTIRKEMIISKSAFQELYKEWIEGENI